MARPKKESVSTLMVDIMSIATRLLGMTDEQIGAWTRKALNDCLGGCIRDDVDELVKECYEKSLEVAKARQNVNAQYYQRRREMAKNSDGDAANREAVEYRKSATSPSTKNKGDAGHREAPDESATIPNSITADGDTREGSLNIAHTGDRATLESGTSADLYDQETDQVSTKRPAAERGKGSRVISLPSDAAAGSLALVTNTAVKKPYGTSGHVMLTDEEGRHLRELYGENLRIAIDILDAYIENGGKAAKKYKNHAAVMRKGNWVWEKVQKMVLDEKRIANADRSGKSFKQMERDREANLMHSSLFAPSIDGTDNKRIANG